MNRWLPVLVIVVLFFLSFIPLYSLLTQEGLFKEKVAKKDAITSERLIPLSDEGEALLQVLLQRTKFGGRKLSDETKQRIQEFLLDEARPLEERLSILFWFLVTKGEISSEKLQEILLADRKLTYPQDFDFIKAKICVLYSNPRIGGRELNTYLPLAKTFILSSIGLTESDLKELEPAEISRRLEGKPLMNVLYAVSVLFLCEKYLGEKNEPSQHGKPGDPYPFRDESSNALESSHPFFFKLLSCIPALSDTSLRLPPPWLKPFSSFSELPKELARTADADFSWEKIDSYPLLITASYGDKAVELAQQNEPALLSLLTELILSFMAVNPPSIYTFLPAVEALDLLLSKIASSSLPEKLHDWKNLSSEFERLRAEMNDTDALVQENAWLIHGKARGDSRILFERIYCLYRNDIGALALRVQSALQENLS